MAETTKYECMVCGGELDPDPLTADVDQCVCKTCGTRHKIHNVGTEDGAIIVEPIVPGEAMPSEKRQELLEKAHRLMKDLVQTEAEKKAVTKTYTDRIKDLKEEIRDTLTLLNGDEEDQDG